MSTGQTGHDPECGRPHDGPGRPRTGWVRVNTAGAPPARWYCSPACAVAALTDASGAPRLDVAACPTCAARHDIGHLCRSCGHVASAAASGYRWRAGRTA